MPESTPQTSVLESPRPKEQFNTDTVNTLLGSMGNHEAKALTLLAMQPGIVYSSGDLFRRVMSLQGANAGWKINHYGPTAYCIESLAPIGLVAQEVVSSDLQTMGYMRTNDRGENLGVPFSGALLAFSSRYPDISLQQIFSATPSPSKSALDEELDRKRAPHLRRKIFWELATSSHPPTLSELVDATGENRSLIHNHIRELKRHGIILDENEDKESDKPRDQVRYELLPSMPEQRPAAVRGQLSLTNFVFDLITSQNAPQEITPRSVYEALVSTRPDKANNVKQPLMALLRGILYNLSQNGYLERFSEEDKEEIKLNPGMSDMLVDLLTVIDGFEGNDQETISLGYVQANEIISDPSTVATLMKKAKEKSRVANNQPITETSRLIEMMLDNFGDMEVTVDRIQNELEKSDGGRSMSAMSIRGVLRYLAKNNKIYSVNRGGKLYIKINKHSVHDE